MAQEAGVVTTRIEKVAEFDIEVNDAHLGSGGAPLVQRWSIHRVTDDAQGIVVGFVLETPAHGSTESEFTPIQWDFWRSLGTAAAAIREPVA